MKIKRWIGYFVLGVIVFGSLPVQACTLWAVNGSLVNGGGSMLVKNRDWLPNQYESLKAVFPKTGYSYFGLYTEGKYSGMKAGINKTGLVVISATAGSIPAEARRAMPHTGGVLVKLLKECSSVDEALARTDLFLGPEILMLADKNKVATIEIGPEGHFAVTVKENSILYHTNHYVSEGMLEFNRTIGESSQKRYDRIGQLLSSVTEPYDFSTVISFSNDQNDGPDNSIFRTGSMPTKPRTMAVWAVQIPPEGSPEVYIRILNPNEAEKVVRITADDVFTGKLVLD
ncbi:MAG: peptidase acyl-coenzyme A:6-aminopenicillanic acid acyl-transferase [Firmicutes bacterium]|nr:peptidase acyl-coenzyme A:6-aminopenicillanic acid acyl-transferase [Bacillota bacterium]